MISKTTTDVQKTPQSEQITDIQQRAVEMILEDERLTNNLTDENATILINWGVAEIELAVKRLSSIDAPIENVEEYVDTLTSTVRHTIKSINRLVPEAADIDTSDLVKALLKLVGRARALPFEDDD